MPAKLNGPSVVINRPSDARRPPGFPEFIALLATMISLVAMSIDMMIPALSQIGRDLAVRRNNDTQLIISLFILGIAVGQLIYGPLSDRTGRRPAVFAGFFLFMGGCLLSLVSVNFPMMLAGRMIQGLGLAGPRVVTMAIIRDQYEGRAMARVMSIIMAVFIIVPAIAPALGQVILAVTGWRAIFGVFLSMSLAVLAWFALRQQETLAPQDRVRFSLTRAGAVFREICTNRAAFGYTVAAGLIFGAFQGYLNSAQQLIQIQYRQGNWSPLYYAMLALSVGSASLMNSRLVMRYGMRWLTRRSSLHLGGLSFIFLAIACLLHGHPPLWALMTYLIMTFFCLGLLFGNLNALAMRPLGHIAGSGAAMVGSFSILLAVPLGIAIGQAYNGTVVPLVGGFALLGTAAAAVIRKSETQIPTNPINPTNSTNSTDSTNLD